MSKGYSLCRVTISGALRATSLPALDLNVEGYLLPLHFQLEKLAGEAILRLATSQNCIYLTHLVYMGGCPRTFYSTGGLRTCPRHRRLLKLHAIYNPPLHLIAFLYSQLTPWYCFSKRVLRMKSIAFFVYGGCVNIFFHSTTPNGSLRRSSFHISCLRR